MNPDYVCFHGNFNIIMNNSNWATKKFIIEAPCSKLQGIFDRKEFFVCF